jgi:hypothetical protein
MERRVMKSMVIVIVSAGLLTSAVRVDAQRPSRIGGSFDVSFVAADAVGELGALVDQGFGFELGGGAPVTESGHLRLRGDLGFLVYGVERLRFCSFGCRVGSELTTTNAIVYAGVGPEIVLLKGDVQPYVNASAGLSYFVTSSSLDDHDGYGSYLETTNYNDVVFGLRYGGGVRFRLGGSRKPVFFDLGVERHDNGVAEYLTVGDIVDHADGSVTVYPNRTDADLVTFKLGVSIGVGGWR